MKFWEENALLEMTLDNFILVVTKKKNRIKIGSVSWHLFSLTKAKLPQQTC